MSPFQFGICYDSATQSEALITRFKKKMDASLHSQGLLLEFHISTYFAATLPTTESP